MHTFELASPKVTISLRFPMQKKSFSLFSHWNVAAKILLKREDHPEKGGGGFATFFITLQFNYIYCVCVCGRGGSKVFFISF